MSMASELLEQIDSKSRRSRAHAASARERADQITGMRSHSAQGATVTTSPIYSVVNFSRSKSDQCLEQQIPFRKFYLRD